MKKSYSMDCMVIRAVETLKATETRWCTRESDSAAVVRLMQISGLPFRDIWVALEPDTRGSKVEPLFSPFRKIVEKLCLGNAHGAGDGN